MDKCLLLSDKKWRKNCLYIIFTDTWEKISVRRGKNEKENIQSINSLSCASVRL